jgi:hypothetical protein
MARIAKTAALAATLAAMLPAAASAQVVGPYDGEIPFNCQLQNVGTGTDFPEPHADPFCVEFDKTNQNITDFGLADFTAQEPARVAAAGDKCFYFQRDHWTGSVTPAASTAAGLRFGLRPPRSQDESPEVWHWDGNYFYDRARGVGGVSVRDFRIGGTPQSASPYAPAAYQSYFDENGGGGVEVLLESDPDPTCGAKVDTPEERDKVYGDRAAESVCIEPSGGIRGRRVGAVKLGDKRATVRAKLGAPTYAHHFFDAWCLVGKGELRVGYGRRGRADDVVTSGSGQALHGVSRGDKSRRAFDRLSLKSARFEASGVHIYYVDGGAADRMAFVGIAHDRVRWVMVGDDDSTMPSSAFRSMLRRMP